MQNYLVDVGEMLLYTSFLPPTREKSPFDSLLYLQSSLFLPNHGRTICLNRAYDEYAIVLTNDNLCKII